MISKDDSRAIDDGFVNLSRAKSLNFFIIISKYSCMSADWDDPKQVLLGPV